MKITQNPTIECACGCKGTLLKFDKRGRERLFLPSHWSRIQPNMRQKVTCENCGNEIDRHQYHLKKVCHHFCSPKCAGRWTAKNGAKRGRLNGHYNTISVACAGCGNAVSRPASLINRRHGRVYCKQCDHLVRGGRKGFYVNYPPEFSNKLRREIRKRDEYTCQICGIHQSDSNYTFHVHHIDYDKANNLKTNLITLCRTCHGQTNFGIEAWKTRLSAIVSQKIT